MVDAGGMGIVVILGGAYLHLTGGDVEEADLELATAAGQIDPSQLASVVCGKRLPGLIGGSPSGATAPSSLIQGQNLDIERVRTELAEKADSLVIVGDDRFIRVHVHTWKTLA